MQNYNFSAKQQNFSPFFFFNPLKRDVKGTAKRQNTPLFRLYATWFSLPMC